jgi:hypothetical protein
MVSKYLKVVKFGEWLEVQMIKFNITNSWFKNSGGNNCKVTRIWAPTLITWSHWTLQTFMHHSSHLHMPLCEASHRAQLWVRHNCYPQRVSNLNELINSNVALAILSWADSCTNIIFLFPFTLCVCHLDDHCPVQNVFLKFEH